jgi:type I restriction enzyme, R subunit
VRTGQGQAAQRQADVITTVINKFDRAALDKARDEGVNVFVLVDESHRSQYGTIHAKMRRVFPNACYIGFTGTPLTRQEKATAEKFGSSSTPTHAPGRGRQGRRAAALRGAGGGAGTVDQAQLETLVRAHHPPPDDEQRADLKRKMSRSEAVSATEQRLKEIAYNVASTTEQPSGPGFKAQLATPSKRIGVKYKKSCRSTASTCAGHLPARHARGPRGGRRRLPEVQAFWKPDDGTLRQRRGIQPEILASFARADGVEILIVVDKLLTGFDEPRNTVLYIDKPLKEHTLLQAIARVNRLFEGKDFGYIVDYRGVLGELNEAINLYDALGRPTWRW